MSRNIERDTKIRDRHSAGESYRELADAFGMTDVRIRQIVSGYKTKTGPKVSVSMAPGLHQRLRLIASERGVSMHEVLHQALDAFDAPKLVQRRGVTLPLLRIQRCEDAA